MEKRDGSFEVVARNMPRGSCLVEFGRWAWIQLMSARSLTWVLWCFALLGFVSFFVAAWLWGPGAKAWSVMFIVLGVFWNSWLVGILNDEARRAGAKKRVEKDKREAGS